MRILIYVDNEKHGHWGLLKILEEEPKTEEEFEAWHEAFGGTEECLNEEVSWEGEDASEVMVPNTGIYIADYTVLPHYCRYPECACDDCETQIDIIDEVPIGHIISYIEKETAKEKEKSDAIAWEKYRETLFLGCEGITLDLKEEKIK